MTRKQAKEKIEEINKLPKKEKKFAKSLFLYRYYVGLASKQLNFAFSYFTFKINT